jgi:predicted phosphodiesterase
MKCLLISDLHYALKQFDWVLTMAHNFEAVIIAGDHLDISSAVDARAQTVVILQYFRRLQAVTQLVVNQAKKASQYRRLPLLRHYKLYFIYLCCQKYFIIEG